jgi:predicted PurR-regulated permease PerM
MIVIGLLVGVSDNIVRSFVLQGRDEMHPLVSLVAMFGGIAMFGIVGVFIGPILAAIVIAVLDTWPSVAAQYGITVGTNEDLNRTLEASKAIGPEDLERRDADGRPTDV